MSERGQAMIEALFVVRLCICCALALVDAAVLVRDRIAVTQAATRAGEAVLSHRNMCAAARDAVPRVARRSVRCQQQGHEITVSARSRTMVLRVPGGIRLHSSVIVDVRGQEVIV